MDLSRGRHAGLLVPLFAAASSRSWGIGEIGDLVMLAAWLRAARLDLLQILPVNEMAPGQTSPYSAISSMAIDPVFISVYALEDFAALGGEATLDAASRARLAAVRASPRVEYEGVRLLKEVALRAAFERFLDAEWRRGGRRAAALGRFVAEQAWWLDDYALFRALHAAHGGQPWWTWAPALARREPAALSEARASLAREVLLHHYLQWSADRQWRRARRAAAAVAVSGDLPFMVDRHSADVWARPGEFRLDATVGTPPDVFSETGQDWGLPVPRWDVMARTDHAWMRGRARRAADLYAAIRVDHAVGLYRTFVRPGDTSEPYFSPAEEPDQLAQGEGVLRILGGAGARLLAEDLGVIPDFVRLSLARLGIPGYRVLRWEREWTERGQPFRDPAAYPPVSVATSGTHDSESLAEWWESATAAERRDVARVVRMSRDASQLEDGSYDGAVRDALLEAMLTAGSDFVILPIQDVFGWRDRVNTPATVGGHNWTYRLPWPVDRLRAEPEARERAAALRRWVKAGSRASARSAAGASAARAEEGL